MSDEHTKAHPAIRTFARDLATARGKRSQETPDDSSVDQKKADKKTPAEPQQNFKAQAPQATTRTVPKIMVPEKKPQREEKPTKETIKQTQTKIPAFHELKRDAKEQIEEDAKAIEKKAPGKQPKPKISVSKKSRKKEGTNIGYDAAVITDNKKSGFHFFSAIGDSLKSWFSAFSFSKKKKSPVYTVPDTQRRKGIIQRATSKSGSIFTADSAELRAKIKQRQKQVETEKQKQQDEDDGGLSWSPYTDSGFNLLESPEDTAQTASPHNVAVTFKKQTKPADLPPDSKPQTPPAPVVETAPETPVPPNVPTPSIDSRWEVKAEEKNPPVEPEPIPEPVPEPQPIPVPEPEPIPEPQPEPEPEPPTQSAPVSSAPAPSHPEENESESSNNLAVGTLDTNTLSISIIAGLAVVAVVFFAGKTAFEYFTATEEVAKTDTTSYLQSATPNPVVVAQINSITDIPLQAGSLLGVNYVDTQLLLPSKVVVSPTTIIAALEFTLLPSFVQSLTDVRFAQINDSAPVVLFEFTDTDTILGGFLVWEEAMAEDLRELYLIAESSNLTFTDKRIAGTDVRVLTKASGQVLVVYGIVSDDTAIITNSLDTFTQVVTASFDQ
jgi:hypothetical protein